MEWTRGEGNITGCNKGYVEVNAMWRERQWDI